MKSVGGWALGGCGVAGVGLLFWAAEVRGRLRSTPRSNARGTSHATLKYPPRIVT